MLDGRGITSEVRSEDWQINQVIQVAMFDWFKAASKREESKLRIVSLG
jgi:hypothetical protein